MNIRGAAPVLLLLLSCASAPPAKLPQWESVPPLIASTLCTRLQMDAIGTGGGLPIVSRTQPFVTPAAISSLAASARVVLSPEAASRALQEANRLLPIELGEGPCGWVPLEPSRRRGSDEVVVEISAPLVNPAQPQEAGMFARAVLGTQEEWYWVGIAPRGGGWVATRAIAISR